MTCIVALCQQGMSYLGADGGCACGLEIIPSREKKVWQAGEFLIGTSGPVRTGQILQYKFTPPPHGNDSDIAYMGGAFSDAVRTCLITNKLAKSENNQEDFEGDALIVYRGHIYYLSCDFAIVPVNRPYAAIGCGAQYALGAMAINTKESPTKRMREALKTSATFSAYVNPPFVILKHKAQHK